MEDLKTVVDYGVMSLLLLLSLWAVAVALERYGYYRRIRVAEFSSRAELESCLTRRLTVIGTVAANAPYIGLLGTVLGIMLTFQALGASGDLDMKGIMTGLSLALKATAMGLAVAIPCVALNNALRRRVKERLAEYDAGTAWHG